MSVLTSISRLGSALVVASLFSSHLPAAATQNPQIGAQEVKPDANPPVKTQVVKPNADTPAKTDGITLKVGDLAPAIKAARWLKGHPVGAFKKGEVYVVEFWATWCGPCKEAMPHITELAKKYAGKVTFIGMDIWEKEKNQKTLDKNLDKFVKNMGEKMGYTVAQDTRDGFMSAAWMKAAGLSGIPQSFIVSKDGRILWQGHPGSIDKTLEKVFAGTFDLQESKAEVGKQNDKMKDAQEAMAVFSPVKSAIDRAIRAKNWPQVLKLAEETLAKLPHSMYLQMCLKAARVQALANTDPAKVQPLLEAELGAARASDYGAAAAGLRSVRSLDKRWSELALSYLDIADTLDPAHAKARAVGRFSHLLRTDEARALSLFEEADPSERTWLAMDIVTSKGVNRAWLERAVATLEPVVKTPDPDTDYLLSPLAKAYFELGRFQEAVAVQEKFVAYIKALDGDTLEAAREDLKAYQTVLK